MFASASSWPCKGGDMVNGALDPNGNGFKFMIWDGDGSGPDDANTLRLHIWWEAGGVKADVYDNGVEQAIGGANMVLHKGQ